MRRAPQLLSLVGRELADDFDYGGGAVSVDDGRLAMGDARLSRRQGS